MLALVQARSPAVAHIGPEHAGQQKAGRHGLAFAHAAVGVLQGGVHKRRLGALHHHVEQRVNAARQTELAQLRNRRQRVAGLQQLEHFVKQAALRHVGQERQAFGNGCGGFGVELEAQRAELGAKAHRADDAHRVFPVAHGRVANHAQGVVFGVFEALVVIDHDLRGRVVVHGVDGEVAANGVFFLRAPDVVAQHAAGRIDGVFHAGQFAFAGFLVARHLFGRSVVQVGAEGGDFNHLVLAPTAIDHVHDAKAPPDDESAAKQAFDLFGRGVGGHVKVFGAQTEQQVAHGAAHDIGDKTGFLQGAHHVDGAVIDQAHVDAMAANRHFDPLAKIGFACACGAAAGQAE